MQEHTILVWYYKDLSHLDRRFGWEVRVQRVDDDDNYHTIVDVISKDGYRCGILSVHSFVAAEIGEILKKGNDTNAEYGGRRIILESCDEYKILSVGFLEQAEMVSSSFCCCSNSSYLSAMDS